MSDIVGLNRRIYTENTTDKQPPKPKAKHSSFVLKLLVFLLLLFLVGEIIFYLFIVPYTSPVRIQFSETEHISTAMVKKAAGLTGFEKWIRLDTKVISGNLARYPLISQATVTKQFPDKLIIEVTERQPAAVLLASVGSRTVPMEVDKTGTVFKIGSDVTVGTLPIVSGLEFSHPAAGMRVHKQLIPLFRQLDILYKKNSVLLSEISEVRIEQKKYGGFDLVVYPVQTNVKVRIGSTLKEENLQYMILVLDVIKRQNLSSKIIELDIRAGTASYRLRGDVDE